jgi:hypothetical protein
LIAEFFNGLLAFEVGDDAFDIFDFQSDVRWRMSAEHCRLLF